MCLPLQLWRLACLRLPASIAFLTSGYRSFEPMAQCAVHVLKGLAHTEVIKKHNIFSMVPKLRYPTGRVFLYVIPASEGALFARFLYSYSLQTTLLLNATIRTSRHHALLHPLLLHRMLV